MTAYCIFTRYTAAAVFAALSIAPAFDALAQQTTGSMNNLKLSNDKPIQIESDKLEIKEQENLALFTGNVKVVQGEMTLQAGTMTVYYRKNGGSPTAGASGQAGIHHNKVKDKGVLRPRTPPATARARRLRIAGPTLVLEGKRVVLSEGANVFTGCKLTVLMDTGRATLDSCGGRVNIQLDPKSRQKKQ